MRVRIMNVLLGFLIASTFFNAAVASDIYVFGVKDISCDGDNGLKIEWSKGSEDIVTTRLGLFTKNFRIASYYKNYGVDPTKLVNLKLENWSQVYIIESNLSGNEIDYQQVSGTISEFNQVNGSLRFVTNVNCRVLLKTNKN